MKYRVTLGNVTQRKGHRSDCAQVRLSKVIDASGPVDLQSQIATSLQHLHAAAHGLGWELLAASTTVTECR